MVGGNEIFYETSTELHGLTYLHIYIYIPYGKAKPNLRAWCVGYANTWDARCSDTQLVYLN